MFAVDLPDSDAAVQRYRARWLFPVDGPPIAGGVVEIAGSQITAVHSRPEPRAVDLGNVALIPGLVNAHTHLEFSDLARPLRPAEPFAAWIQALVAHRRTRRSPVARIVGGGLDECQSAGTTLLGEIATAGWSPEAFPPRQPRAVVFRESIGLTPEAHDEQLRIARDHLRCADDGPDGTAPVLRGISPHAPYSVPPNLYRELIALAVEQDAPVAVHLAETPAELELLATGTGELVELMRNFGVWRDDCIPRGSRPLDYLRPLAACRHGLVIHGNFLDGDDIEFLAGHPHLSVVYCPRTHAYFGFREHPWRRLLERGVNVALGTDSRASNPDLSLWNEVLFLARQFPGVPEHVLLQLATIGGARALGCDADAGTITPGKRADLAAISLPGTASLGSSPQLLNPAATVIGTMQSGQWRVCPISRNGTP